jgi:hypothetical protein
VSIERPNMNASAAQCGEAQRLTEGAAGHADRSLVANAVVRSRWGDAPKRSRRPPEIGRSLPVECDRATAPRGATEITRLRERLAGAGRDESGSVRTVSATATAHRIDGD